MGRKTKIEEYKLVEYLQKDPYGPHPKRAIAKHFHAGQSAVDAAVRRLRNNNLPVAGTPAGILLWKQGTRDKEIIVIMLDAQAQLAITGYATTKQAGQIKKMLADDVPQKTMKRIQDQREESA